MSYRFYRAASGASALGRLALGLSTALAVATLLPATSSAGQEGPAKLVPFGDFARGLATAHATDFIGKPGVAVNNDADFEQMRAHLLKLYGGQHVARSLIRDGITLDCIELSQQPAMRIQGLKSAAEAPPFSPQEAFGTKATEGDKMAGQQAHVESVACPKGSFAMPRVTLEQMTRFDTIGAFFAKGPHGAGQVHTPEQDIEQPNTNGHAYSYAYQYLNNWGGQSTLSLNNPYVYTNEGEVFSLMQQWYVGGSGSSTQTAEVGWQNFPNQYGTENPVLFAYYTADDYNRTGCYNYTCGAFVQYGGAPISLGEYWNHYSIPGNANAQYIITIGYYFYQGNWWLAYGTGWVGYYPGSLYGSGQLSHNATLVEFGTESVGSSVWPAEGSGQWASKGWPYSGFQYNLEYRNSQGSLLSLTGLTSTEPSPKCYTDTPEAYGGSTWEYYFYLGGPGGTGC
jgi:hypothetical protein